MKSLLSLVALMPMLSFASNSSPYVTGHWNLDDSFKDFKTGAPIVTNNTEFNFDNPTGLTLTLEYAFFAPDGTFCGCDRDTLQPSGRTRYTMQGELEGGQFSRTLCPTQTDGVTKSIVFESVSSIGDDNALQNGTQIHIAPGIRTESDLNAVPVTASIEQEMNRIHQLCVNFIGS